MEKYIKEICPCIYGAQKIGVIWLMPANKDLCLKIFKKILRENNINDIDSLKFKAFIQFIKHDPETLTQIRNLLHLSREMIFIFGNTYIEDPADKFTSADWYSVHNT